MPGLGIRSRAPEASPVPPCCVLRARCPLQEAQQQQRPLPCQEAVHPHHQLRRYREAMRR